MTRIDRRALFATGSAAALLAAVGVSAADAPVRGGELRAALSGGDRGEDWLTQPGGAFLKAARFAVFETLTEIAADGTLQPGLALSWHSSDSGRVWSFRMRENVLFHDGSLMQPRDVVASLKAAGFDAEASDTVDVRLPEADPAFPFRAARGGYAVFRADELRTGGPLVTGTGLYQIARFDAGRSFIGTRVEKHRKDGSAGWFDRVEIVAVSDDAVRAEALRDGIVDVADLSAEHDLCDCDRVSVLRDEGQIRAAVREGIRHNTRLGPHPLDDMRFVERWWKTA